MKMILQTLSIKSNYYYDAIKLAVENGAEERLPDSPDEDGQGSQGSQGSQGGPR
jgi:hypothetical protein